MLRWGILRLNRVTGQLKWQKQSPSSWITLQVILMRQSDIMPVTWFSGYIVMHPIYPNKSKKQGRGIFLLGIKELQQWPRNKWLHPHPFSHPQKYHGFGGRGQSPHTVLQHARSHTHPNYAHWNGAPQLATPVQCDNLTTTGIATITSYKKNQRKWTCIVIGSKTKSGKDSLTSSGNLENEPHRILHEVLLTSSSSPNIPRVPSHPRLYNKYLCKGMLFSPQHWRDTELKW